MAIDTPSYDSSLAATRAHIAFLKSLGHNYSPLVTASIKRMGDILEHTSDAERPSATRLQEGLRPSL